MRQNTLERDRGAQSSMLLFAGAVTVSMAAGLMVLLTQHNPLMALVAMVAAGAAFAALASTEAALYALIAVACVDGLLKGLMPGMASLLLKDAFLVAALVHWMWDGVNRQPRDSLSHPVAMPAVLFIVYCAAQTFNSETMSWQLAIAGLRSWIIWIPIFFIAYDTLRTRRQFERMMMFIAVVSAGTGIYIIIQHQMGFSHLYSLSSNFGFYTRFEHGGITRAPGTYVHPGPAGSAMSFAAMVCAGVGLAARAFSTTQILLLASAPVCLIAMFATGSRAPLVGGLVGILVFLILARRPQLWIAMAVVLLIGIWQSGQYTGRITEVRYSQSRLNLVVVWHRAAGPFRQGFDMLSRFPLGTGVASGAGAGRALAYMDEPVHVREDTAIFIENEIGRAMKELGAPGVVLLLWLLYRAIRGAVAGWRTSTGRDRWLAGGLIAGAANMALQLMVGSALYLAPGGIYFWIACALASRLPDYEAQDRETLTVRTEDDLEAWEELAARAPGAQQVAAVAPEERS